MAVLLVREDREYLVAPGDTLETDLGVLEVPETVSPDDTIETHLGTAFDVRSLRCPDFIEHFERTGAPMLPRDIGLIMGITGVGAGDRILDAGTGTGVLAATCGHAGADVLTYERDAEFASVARDNMTRAGVEDRVDVRTADITEAVEALSSSSFDVITLDLAAAPQVIDHAPDLLTLGGSIAVYSPFVEAARDAVAAARDVGLSRIETRETIQREMDFDDRGSRPSTSGVGHTGYLTFARHL